MAKATKRRFADEFKRKAVALWGDKWADASRGCAPFRDHANNAAAVATRARG
jgi:hypothetical protein